MLPPIPDPNSPQVSIPRSPRPTLLKYFVGFELVFANVDGILYKPIQEEPEGLMNWIYWFIYFLWFVALYCLWNGKNWARILIMVNSVLALSWVFGIVDYLTPFDLLQTVLVVIKVAWSVIFLWYLSSPQIIAFCKRRATPEQEMQQA